MDEKISLKINGQDSKSYYKGITLKELSKDYQLMHKAKIVAAIVDNDLAELNSKITEDCVINFVDLIDTDGMRIYQRGLCFMLVCAVKEVLGNHEIMVEHAIGRALYCDFANNDITLDKETVLKIEKKMHELVEKDIPLEKLTLPIDDAIEILKKHNMADKIKLFRYKRASAINLYKLGDNYDYFYGYMVPSTGYLDKFSLSYKEPGLVINLPHKKEPDKVSEFKPLEKLTQIFQEYTDWGRILDVNNVGDLNDLICKGEASNLIRVSETLHEKKMSYIADMICDRHQVGVVLIAGPSSSGKTTFAHKLCIHLRVNGLKPFPISLDNYYVDREMTPKDENGDYDFEALEAIDFKLFNSHLKSLLDGETVELPYFNFKTGKREYKGNFLKLKENEILIIEGIHGLNERLSSYVPKEKKFKIYLSALTQLNIDNHNRIPTTDTRLIRRIVRDNHFRGFTAESTIAMWPSVRAGEEKNIFPFQEQADVMFNSSHIYELSVLKQYVEPLLFQIEKDSPHYREAKRLIKFLDYFLTIPSDDIPNNSLIREFIGGSCFKV